MCIDFHRDAGPIPCMGGNAAIAGFGTQGLEAM